MAFFKFRWPGQPSQPQATEPPPAPKYPVEQAETVEQVTRRAWHRMIGAAVLLISWFIGISLLLDTTPRGVAPKVTFELPNRNEAVPLPLPPVTVADGLGADEQIITGPPPEIAAASTAVPPAFQELPEYDPEAMPPSLPVSQEPIPVAVSPPPVVPPPVISTPNVQPESPKPAPTKKPASKPEPVLTEADYARALLEGKIPVVPEARRAQALLENRPIASAVVPKTGSHVVQAGVYFSDKVQAVRDKLERAGFKTYVEEVRLKDGKKGLRVRIGPFATRDEAEKVEKRIKSMGLEAQLFAL